MAKYRITGPDGGTYEITAPDDATEADILSYAQENYSAGPDFSSVTSQVLPGRNELLAEAQQQNVDDMGSVDRFLAAAGQSVDSNIRGLKQAATDSAQRGVGMVYGGLDKLGLTGTANDLARGIGVPLARAQASQLAEADERKRVDTPLLSTPAGFLGNVAGHVSQLAVPLGELGAATRGAGLLGRAAASIPTGAALGAVAPVATGESRAQNAAIGGLLGPVGEALGAGAGLLAKRGAAALNPIKERAIALARQQDIPLHISQLSDSLPVKTLASAAKYLPFSGASEAAGKQQEAFNRAVGRTFGADVKQFDDDAIDAARRALSNQFEGIYNRNSVPIGDKEIASLKSVADSVKKRLTLDESSVLDNQLATISDELLAAQSPGVLTGQKYQALRSQLMRAEGPDKVGRGVAELRKQLDDIAADAVGPEDASTLKDIRRQWANLRTTQKALSQVEGSKGNVRPASLWPIVKGGSTKEMRDLARIGQVLLKDPIPDSGTPGRMVASSLLSGGAVGGAVGGAGAILPLAGLLMGGATVGRALNSPTAARILAAHPVGQAAGLLGRFAAPGALAVTPAAAGAANRRRKARDDD